jgi:hypothetical protein
MRRRRQLDLAGPNVTSVPMASLQATFADLMLPTSTSGTYDLQTALGLATVVLETGIKAGLQVTAGASTAILPTPLLTTLRQAREFVDTARRRMPSLVVGTPARGTLASWIADVAVNRQQAVSLGRKLELMHEKGRYTAELSELYGGWLESTQILMNDAAELLARTDVRTAFNAVAAVASLDITADQAARALREPVPKFVPRDRPLEGLAGIVVPIVIIAVLVAIVWGLHIWNEPARIESESRLVDAQSRRRAMDGIIDRAFESGMDPDELARALDPTIPIGPSDGSFPWGTVALVGLAVGAGWLLFAPGARGIRTSVRTGAARTAARFRSRLPSEPTGEETP